MITRVQALNYRCLRYVDCSLSPLQILVGPNGSGKTTFLDVIAFLGDLVSESGVGTVIEQRTRNPVDLRWSREPGEIELAIEASIPSRLTGLFPNQSFDTIRYQVQLALEGGSREPEIRHETAFLKIGGDGSRTSRSVFPRLNPPPRSVLLEKSQGMKVIFEKAPGTNDVFYSETTLLSGIWSKDAFPPIRLGPKRSTFGSLLEDEALFPVSSWLKLVLKEGVQEIILNSLLIRQASPPGKGKVFKPDGSNLPWVVMNLEKESPERFQHWIAHLQTALPDLEGIRVEERKDDRHAYLMVRYRGGLEVPSWMVSDGTLRLLALTILAYIPGADGIYLIEEPENGIHPTAVETVYQSLSSVYDGQVLVATHSPIMLAVSTLEQILCFAKTVGGETDIVRGDEHPDLSEWRGEVNIGELFAAGVLG